MFQGIKKPASRSCENMALQDTLSGSFFRAVGRTMKCHRLGSLLMASGLVSKDELDHALSIQKETGEQLGKILIRGGVISAVHLYRKLAEQWCLKATTAGVAAMMMLPGEAAAAEQDITPQFQMAAAAVNPASLRPAAKPRGAEYPSLFGSSEVKSSDISAFRKWTQVIARFEDQMRTQGSTPRIMMWKSTLKNLEGQSARAMIEGVNDYVNDVRYIEDKNNYGKSDYWATPAEFFSKGGDCEDFAIAKYASLRALGFTTDQLRIAIVQDTVKNIAHAILIVYSEDGIFVLDNQDKRLREASSVARYQPIFSINSSSWWLHKQAVS
jgi:predicted transglutaminase-like cysteine proteinase